MVPRKVDILIWRILLEKIPTRLNYEYQGINNLYILCLICTVAIEHLDHLFIMCELAERTRNLIFK